MPRLQIYYSHDIFASQVHGGISRYFAELIAHLPADGDGFRAEILAGLHVNRHLDGLAGSRVIRGARVPDLAHTRFARLAVNERLQSLYLKARAGRPSVLHHTYPWASPRARGPRVVVTVHDMIHELYPRDFSAQDRTSRLKREWCERAIESGGRIIAVSESTRGDLLRHFSLDPAKVSVIHHGTPALGAPGADALAKLDRAEPYVLFVGSRSGYKNFIPSLRAFARSPRLSSAFEWICLGGGGFTSAERSAIAELKLDGRVHQVSGDDRELAARFARARALIYPSLYEGFGIPPLEAMSLGCPVLCSRTSSIPEVVGDAGAYFDPSNEASMLATMESHLLSDSALATLVERGREQVRRFSWDQAAQQTLAVYAACS